MQIPLKYSKPHELAVAVILSAQCTDERVNRITPILFNKYKRPEDYYMNPAEELEKMIFSAGFYRNKARSIRGFCRMLVESYGGVLPREFSRLLEFPGMGRKSANVITQALFHEASGIVVDTHVARLSGVLGLSKEKSPEKIEKDLMKAVQKEQWILWSLYMIYLGRSFCRARRRDCTACPLSTVCPSSVLSE